MKNIKKSENFKIQIKRFQNLKQQSAVNFYFVSINKNALFNLRDANNDLRKNQRFFNSFIIDVLMLFIENKTLFSRIAV